MDPMRARCTRSTRGSGEPGTLPRAERCGGVGLVATRQARWGWSEARRASRGAESTRDVSIGAPCGIRRGSRHPHPPRELRSRGDLSHSSLRDSRERRARSWEIPPHGFAVGRCRRAQRGDGGDQLLRVASAIAARGERPVHRTSPPPRELRSRGGLSHSSRGDSRERRARSLRETSNPFIGRPLRLANCVRSAPPRRRFAPSGRSSGARLPDHAMLVRGGVPECAEPTEATGRRGGAPRPRLTTTAARSRDRAAGCTRGADRLEGGRRGREDAGINSPCRPCRRPRRRSPSPSSP